MNVQKRTQGPKGEKTLKIAVCAFDCSSFFFKNKLAHTANFDIFIHDCVCWFVYLKYNFEIVAIV